MRNYRVALSNNDITLPQSPAAVLDDLDFELNTAIKAALVVSDDLSLEDAMKEIDNLKWLIKKEYEASKEKYKVIVEKDPDVAGRLLGRRADIKAIVTVGTKDFLIQWAKTHNAELDFSQIK